ncbi:MAG TPA: hypothetical protein VIM11_28525, partial [Tepidisphaeraceae bacterium]
LSIESFSRLVARAAVSIATGCNDYLPDGTLTRWTPTPFSRRTTSTFSNDLHQPQPPNAAKVKRCKGETLQR